MPAASQSPGLCLESSASAPCDAAQGALRTDEAAFRLLYEQSAPKLFAYLLRVSGERAVAEDLLQEAYCRFLLSKLPDISDAQHQNYLFRIATIFCVTAGVVITTPLCPITFPNRAPARPNSIVNSNCDRRLSS